MTAKTYSLAKSRRAIQWIGVIGAFVLGLRHIMPGEASRGGSFDSFCPFGAVETLLPYILTGHTLKTTNLLNFSIMLGVLGVALVAGRAFCGWMCPLGAIQDFLAAWGRRLSGERNHMRGKASKARFPIHMPAAADKYLRYAKYLILALILVASLYAVYPPLYEFCPVRAVFGFKMTTLLWSVLITFIVTSAFVERAWCKYLCPLGALLAIFNKISPLRLVVNHARCNGCGRCDVECSMGIQDVPERLRDAECIQCLECLETCARDDSLSLKLGWK
ncbi:MAG: iron-sulfur binding protein [Anaerolineaceae bacterium]|nr:MAG: iron-sulfur binding protein [Anaerolineaceae bacterium]